MDVCTRCGKDMEPDAQFCTSCGANKAGDARRPEPEWPQVPHADGCAAEPLAKSGRIAALLVAGVVGVLAVGGLVLAVQSDRGTAVPYAAAPELPFTTPQESTTAPATPSTPPLGRPTVVAAIATCTAPSSRDAGGRPTSYEAGRAVDGVTTTAWRCEGDGSGQQLQLRFDGAVELHRIGLIPGLAKTDPVDGTDRYAQNRRVSSVRYDFDDGSSVVQRCNTTDLTRSVQAVPLHGVRTSSVTVTILDSVPGAEQNRQAAVDTIAISEVVVA
jgi:zinc-ribbon domain